MSKSNLKIKYQKMEINFVTNITNDDKGLIFTKKLLYNPDINAKRFTKYSEYPYIAINKIYPIRELKKYRYVEKLDFFFNGSFMEKRMNLMSDKVNKIHQEKGIYEKEAENQGLIIDENIKTMLYLLFPTAYPFINNTGNSFERKILRTSNFTELIFFPKYSYIKVNNDVHTVIRVLWLNDVLNHPKYYEFVTLLYEYITWGEKERERLENETTTLANKLKTKFENFNTNKVLNKIKQQKKNFDTQDEEVKKRYADKGQTLDALIRVLEDKRKDIFNENPVTGEYYWVNFNNNDIDYILAKNEGEKKYQNESNKWNKDLIDNVDFLKTIRENQIDWSNEKMMNKVFIKNGVENFIQGTIKKKYDDYIFIPEDDQISETIDNTTELGKILSDNGIRLPKEDNKYEIKLTIELVRELVKIKIEGNNIQVVKKKDDTNELIVDKVSDFLTKLSDYKKMGSVARSGISVDDNRINDEKFNIWVGELEKERTRIFSMNTFRIKYLDCSDGDNTDDKRECIQLDINDKTNYDSRFDQFKETIEKYKNFMSSKYKNLNSEFQDLIDAYGNNDDPEKSKRMVNIITKIYENFIQTNKEQLENKDKYLKIGASQFNLDKPKLPNYQIYVMLDLIKGEVNKKNKKLIKCNFEDRYLNKGFYKYFLSQLEYEKWKIDPYPYVELIETEEFKKEREEKQKKLESSEEGVISQDSNTEKKGGKKKKSHRKKRTMRKRQTKNKNISFKK